MGSAVDRRLTLDGPMKGETFRAWTGQFPVPTLRPGEIVIMDNLPSHKVTGIKDAIEATGARLRDLPPYSRDLNPIEQVFTKFKVLRKFPPQECAAYLAHRGDANQSRTALRLQAPRAGLADQFLTCRIRIALGPVRFLRTLKEESRVPSRHCACTLPCRHRSREIRARVPNSTCRADCRRS